MDTSTLQIAQGRPESNREATGQRLLEFTGRECPHCLRMDAVVAAVEREIGRPIEQLEVWHHEENARLMGSGPYTEKLREAGDGFLGVPAFYNEATGEALCGEQDQEALLAWARGKDKGLGHRP